MKRKRLVEKCLSIILSMVMILGLMPVVEVSAASANDKIAEIKQTYPVGSYFVADSNGKNLNGDKNYACQTHGNRCGYFGGGYQCKGFANYVFYRMFNMYLPAYIEGQKYTLVSSNNIVVIGTLVGSNITTDNVKNLLLKAKAGDVLQTYRTTNYGNSPHSMIVQYVNGYGVSVYEANNPSGTCGVAERTISYSKFASTYNIGISLNRASNYDALYSGGGHTHNWKYAWDWSAHPHYSEYKCTTCGEIKTERTPNYRSDCGECNPPPTPVPQPPSAPSIRVSEANFAVGKSVTVSWNAVDTATGYDVSLTHSGNSSYNKSASVGGTSTSFNIDNAGTYTVVVKAKNQYGSSGNSNTVTIKAYDPSIVTFVDYDGTVLSEQSVRYGEPATEPSAPSREGYTFTGWDKTFSKITSATTVTAQYKINTYTVRFYDSKGNVVKTQKIEHGSSATPPEAPAADIGYVFAGWDTEDYKCVKKDLSVQAVFVWENNDLPIKFTTAPIVKRNEMGSGYTADITLYNYPDITTDGKIVIVLKTSSGKMVASKTEAISLSAGESAERSIFVPYDGVASTAEITVVAIIDNDKTGVPISEKAVIDVDLNLEWSNWSETKPADSDALVVEERTEYRYKTKSTTTSSNSTMSGWTLYDTTSSWGGWSGWYNYDPGSSSTRQTQTRYIQPTYKTQYKYSGWKSNSGHWHFCPTLCRNYNGSAYWIESEWQDWDIGLTYFSEPQYCSCHGTFYGYYNDTVNHLYYKESRTVEVTPGYTQWQYRDLNYTYHFYKWGDWSDWSTDSVSATDSREVETRTVYRYKSKFSVDMEDNEGTERTISGAIENVEDGKQVTLYVFKGTNTDPTESQLEYVAQSTLTDGGKYSFNYTTKEEPSEQTGDFIIMVGVEGALAPFYVDVIKAPVPEYTVEFAVDGEVIDTQTVSEGESATIPSIPEKEGHTFVGWDTGVTNIRDDMTINAVYVPNKYSVVFLDWDNRTIDAKTFSYGDVLETPEASGKEGSTFAGWDKILEGTTKVTSNMVITATYNLNDYEVVFYDGDGSVLSKQTVKYGEAAEVPGDPTLEGYVFDEWASKAELMCVTQDMNVYPIFKYEKTAANPVFSMYSVEDSESNIVMISSDNDNAIIYYTTDGTDPYVASSELGIEDVNGSVYSGSLQLNYGTVLKAIAYVDGQNISEVVACNIEAFSEDDYDDGTDTDPEVTPTPTPTPIPKDGPKVTVSNVSTSKGKTVDVAIDISDNTGFANLSLEIGYDQNVMRLTKITNNTSVPCVYTSAQSTETNPYNMSWDSTSNVVYNGNLATLTFEIKESATDGVYPVTISYYKGISGNYTDGEDVNYDADFNSLNLNYVNGAITVSSHMAGDINGDGKVNNQDGTFLLRHLAGWNVNVDESALDVNGDGKINNQDGTVLLRYLAGWSVTIH